VPGYTAAELQLAAQREHAYFFAAQYFVGENAPFRYQQLESQMANEGYHEPVQELSDETRDMHRAITSLMEELEAVDWYNQRVDACKDNDLKAILAHNRDEEKEHASMVLEWIRRNDPTFDKELKDYLFTKKPIAHG
jgi:ferritin-like protein